MTYHAFLEVAIPLWGIQVVAAGIHLRRAAPAQRRGAWWNFGVKCLLVVVTSLLLLWRPVPIFGPRNFVYTGGDLAVMILFLIMLGIVSVGLLLQELRQVFAGRTTVMDVPPEA
jgi:hypothetical protein